MKALTASVFVSCLIAACTAFSADVLPVGVEADFDIRSAYHSRMRVSEDRPVAASSLKIYADAGRLGKFGVLHWNYSSLCNRRSDVHRRAFVEADFSAFWRYGLELSEKFTLSSEFMCWWMTLPQNIDPYRGKSDNTTYELWYVGSLKNPYLVPSILVRRGWLNKSWVYFRYGVSKPFELCDFGDGASPKPLTLTPGFFVETGDNGIFESRFGKKESGRYHTGIGSCIAQVSLDWKATENLSLFAMLQQFDLVSSDARDGVHGNYRRDFTMCRFGMKLSF